MLKLTFCLRQLSALPAAELHDYWPNWHGLRVRRRQLAAFPHDPARTDSTTAR